MRPLAESLGSGGEAEASPLRPGEWAFHSVRESCGPVTPLNPRGIASLSAFESNPWSAEIGLAGDVEMPHGTRVVLSLTGPGFEHRLRGRVEAFRNGPSGCVAIIVGTARGSLGIPGAIHAGDDGVRLRLEGWTT